MPISILQMLNSENDSEAAGALIALKQVMGNKILAKILAIGYKVTNQEFIKAKEAFDKSPESPDSQVLAKLKEKYIRLGEPFYKNKRDESLFQTGPKLFMLL